jgi:hypothetical protein
MVLFLTDAALQLLNLIAMCVVCLRFCLHVQWKSYSLHLRLQLLRTTGTRPLCAPWAAWWS